MKQVKLKSLSLTHFKGHKAISIAFGDSTKSEDVERLMNGEKADMVFTDPDFSKSATPEAQPIGSAVGG